jgi:hypothetical protein
MGIIPFDLEHLHNSVTKFYFIFPFCIMELKSHHYAVYHELLPVISRKLITTSHAVVFLLIFCCDCPCDQPIGSGDEDDMFLLLLFSDFFLGYTFVQVVRVLVIAQNHLRRSSRLYLLDFSELSASNIGVSNGTSHTDIIQGEASPSWISTLLDMILTTTYKCIAAS